MYIARWQFTAQSGQTNKCIALLRRWSLEIGHNIGWKPSAVRIVNGVIGAPAGEIELETHLDDLSDLENAWKDLSRGEIGKAHEALMAQLDPLITSGTSRWNIYNVVDVIPAD